MKQPPLPRSVRVLLALAGLYGLAAIVLSALGAHLVKPEVWTADYQAFLDARFLFLSHTLAMLALGLALGAGFPTGKPNRLPPRAWLLVGYGWALGALLFAGPIFVKAFSGYGGLGKLSPLGGTLLMVSWLGLGVLALFYRKK